MSEQTGNTGQLTPEDRARLRALAAQATPGPWEFVCDGGMVIRRTDGLYRTSDDVDIAYMNGDSWDGNHEEDAAFIAEARTALPALLDAIDERDAEVERLRGMLQWALPHCQLQDNESLEDYRETLRDIRALLGEKAGE